MRTQIEDLGVPAARPTQDHEGAAGQAARHADFPRLLRIPALTGLAVVIAAVTLPVGTPTYDVWAWLLWGRESAGLDLDTTFGPAWKPLPVAVATLFAPTGDAQPYVWMFVARAGTLLAPAAGARLAWRATGTSPAAVRWLAALGTAAGMLATPLWLGYMLPYGMSDAMLGAAGLWAVDRHLAGRRDQAWWVLILGGMLRPEIWAAIVLYAAWAWWRRAVRRWEIAVGLLLLPVAWFALQGLGSGKPFRLGQGQAAPDGPLLHAHPGVAVLRQLPSGMPIWVWAGALLGLVVTVVTRDRLLAALAVAGVAWIAIIAVMAELRLGSGISRYLVITHVTAAVLAGVGWARSAAWFGRALSRGRVPRMLAAVPPVLVVLAAAAVSVPALADELSDSARDIRFQDNLQVALTRAVDEAGGPEQIVACGPVWTGSVQVTRVAWELGIPISAIRTLPLPGAPASYYEGVLLQTRDRLMDPVGPTPNPFLQWEIAGKATVGASTWTVFESCPTGADDTASP